MSDETEIEQSWPFAKHFRAGAIVAACSVLDRLDPLLAPTVVLVAIPRDGENWIPGLRATIDASKGPLLVHDFEASLRRALTERAVHDSSIGVFSGRLDEFREGRRARMEALVDAFDKRQLLGSRRTWCAWPRRLDSFEVYAILSVDLGAYERVPRVALDADRRYETHPSLVDATVAVLLDEFARALESPAAGALEVIYRPAEELTREAGKRFMWVAGLQGRPEDAIHLYQICDELSSLLHESREARGRLVVAGSSFEPEKWCLKFTTPIPLSERDTARKLLETTAGGRSLVTDVTTIRGLCDREDLALRADGRVFEVCFARRGRWDLRTADRRLMVIRDREPELPRPLFSREKEAPRLAKEFPGLDQVSIDRICSLLELAAERGKGTTLVFAEAAEAEARRFARSSLSISPIPLSKETLSDAMSIDGAILLGLDGTCHAIGVILDGQEGAFGTFARGSRYNSAARYVASDLPGRRAAIVFSEDGKIDVLVRHELAND